MGADMADPITTPLARHLCSLDGCDPAPCPDHVTTAGTALKFLASGGAILPVGVSIGAVYRVTRGGDCDGYRFTDQRDADRQAWYGGQSGTPGVVETAWRVQADGVDVTSAWQPATNPREEPS